MTIKGKVTAAHHQVNRGKKGLLQLQAKAIDSSEKLAHASGRKRIGGLVLREIAYRPDMAGAFGIQGVGGALAHGVIKRWSPGKTIALERAASKTVGYRFMTKKGRATLKARNYAQAELGARDSQAPHFREAGTMLRSMARKEIA